MRDQLLKRMTIEVRSFAVCEVRRGWPLETPPLGSVSLHYVLRGKGSLRDSSNQSLPLAPGSLVICPPNQRLTVSETVGDSFQLPHCEPASGTLEWLSSQRDDRLPGVLILCGMLDVVTPELGGSPFDRLQAPVRIASANAAISPLFEALFEELTTQALGCQAMIDALMKQCLVLLLRELQASSVHPAWLLALEDPALGAAVSAMTEDLGRRIGIEELAALSHMSRTTFIARFKRAYGLPPQRFLAEQRLRQGRDLLVATSLSVKQVALRCAYRSRSQFSAAFKSRFGRDPEHYRRDPRGDSR
ncbi:AraC family transcriptional regulator [Halomonas sp. ATCH28]|uniref:AraC family transcriptional regulator n=1 Tax=Halomonas gemina TaxID=2945105 RepID=A0ABT0T4N5_9GAMM|nr:AraC family transcriptional regulator [Halomonas gemina]MCL7941699.1 AraC family transcriptional regulator [Halomonas gemina]